MNILKLLKQMFFVNKCIICEHGLPYDETFLLCEDCLKEWNEYLKTRCNRCEEKRNKCCCLPYDIRKTFDHGACWSVFYNGNIKDIDSPDSLVYVLKRTRDRDVINFCGEMMRKSLVSFCIAHRLNYREFVVTYAPRSKENARKYDFDQSKELAKYLAKKLGIEFVEVFENRGKQEQKKLDRYERIENAKENYHIKKDFINKHKKYFLVDDILTSGATLCRCGELLYFVGADEVIPVTYAKDNINKGE